MAKDQTMVILLFLVACCCLSSIVAGALWGTNVLCDKTNPESQMVGLDCPSVYESSGTPATTTGTTDTTTGTTDTTTGTPLAATDPRATVWATGQKLQGDPLEIGDVATPIPVNPKPTLPSTVVYTVSFDLKYASTGTTWRELLSSNWLGTIRRPMFSITGTAADNGGANKFIVIHQPASETTTTGAGVYTSKTYSPGVWYNIVFTVDATNTVKLYVNGTLDSSYTYPSALSWGDSQWWWRPTNAGVPSTDKSVQVANAYFWSSVLSTSDIAKLVIPATADPNVPTTSYYTSQPVNMGTSAYTKEMYMPY
jgi:hypothetical protein